MPIRSLSELLRPAQAWRTGLIALARAHGPVALVVLVAALVSFVRCDCPLQEPQEARYAEIPREMLAAGEVVVPLLGGQPYLDKPPLLYWLVMGSYHLFGVSDRAARLVPCLAVFLTLLLTHAWGRRALGPRPALLGTLLLALSGRAIQLGRLLGMDGLLMLTVVAGWAAGHRALASPGPRRVWWLALGTAVGLGLLAKGPVALVLIVGPLALMALIDRRWQRPSLAETALGLATALVLAGPWYVAISMRMPGFLAGFLWDHHVRRYVTPFDHAGPWWYYGPVTAFALFPGSLLIPCLSLLCRRSGPRPPSLVPLLMMAAFALAFFSLAGCKRPAYVLPALPPLALVLGAFLESRWRPSGFAASWAGCGLACLAALLTTAILIQPAYAERCGLARLVRQAAAVRGQDAVVCYPRPWDSVRFYLGAEVPVITPDQAERLRQMLAAMPRLLIFVKAGPDERAVRAMVPAGRRFEVLGEQGGVVLAAISSR